jgi:hypothetical protein
MLLSGFPFQDRHRAIVIEEVGSPSSFFSPPVRRLITAWHIKVHTLPPCHGALHLLSSVDLLGTRSRPCWLSGEDSSKVGESTYTEQREGVLHVIRDAAR